MQSCLRCTRDPPVMQPWIMQPRALCRLTSRPFLPRRTLRAIDLGVREPWPSKGHLSQRPRRQSALPKDSRPKRPPNDVPGIPGFGLRLPAAPRGKGAPLHSFLRSLGPSWQRLYISRKPCRLPGLNMHLYTASGLASAPEHAAVGYLRTVDLHRTIPQCLSHRTRKLPAFQTVCSAFGASSSSPRISELDFSSS